MHEAAAIAGNAPKHRNLTVVRRGPSERIDSRGRVVNTTSKPSAEYYWRAVLAAPTWGYAADCISPDWFADEVAGRDAI